MKKVLAFKKVVLKIDKDGNEHYHPLFVQRHREFKLNERFDAETVNIEELHGLAFRQIVVDGMSKGALHVCFKPNAPHIADKLSNGEKRCWLKGFVIVNGLSNKDYEVINRCEAQGGKWLLCTNFTPTERLK